MQLVATVARTKSGPKDMRQDVKDVFQGPLESCGDPESVFKDACPRGPVLLVSNIGD